MKYPIQTLWTWDGIRQHYKVLSDTVVPFKAEIVKYTDTIGYGMYMEIATNIDLDFNDGGLVHNVPDHVNNEMWDISGWFWCMQMRKLQDRDDKRHYYSLTDLTFGNSSDFAVIEGGRGKTTKYSTFIRALQNANPDVAGLFIDGATSVDDTQYLDKIDDSKTPIMWTSGDTKGKGRDELIDTLKRLGERHAPRLTREPSYGRSNESNFDWFLKPIPDFRKRYDYQAMIDEFELEEIADQIITPQYTAIRQYAFKSWAFTDSTGKTNIMKDPNYLTFYTQYLDINGNVQTSLIHDMAFQEMVGMPLFYAEDSSGNVKARLLPPKRGAIKYIELNYEIQAEIGFQDLSNQLLLSKNDGLKSYKVYRILDVNQKAVVNYKQYNVMEVDYIEETSVIGRVTGVI